MVNKTIDKCDKDQIIIENSVIEQNRNDINKNLQKSYKLELDSI